MIRRGFTIVEILIVITVMGVLLTLGVVNLRSSQVNSRDVERKADIESIVQHLDTYYNIGTDNSTSVGKYPSTAAISGSDSTGSVNLLVVGGGGGGGMDMGGGGGGGGVVASSFAIADGQSYTVTVGNGGNGAPAAGTSGQPGSHQYTVSATNGGNSSFSTVIAYGGGRGGSSYYTYTPGAGGANGGSGGGTSGYSSGVSTTMAGGLGTAGQGNNGGQGGGQYYSGGGGGAGGPGANSPNQPNGGIGIQNSINGTNLYWGGGGGGASYTLSTGGNGGAGGGGGGAIGTTTGGSGLNPGSAGGGGAPVTQANTPGGNGGANTGGGGGGGAHYNSNNKGGNGGSGIVIVSYPSSAFTATGGTITYTDSNNTNSRTSPAYSGGYTIHTFTTSGTFTVTGGFPAYSVSYFLRDIDSNSIKAPGVTNSALTFIAATNNNQTTSGVTPQPTINQYVYQPLQKNGTLCTSESTECSKFNLYYRLELDNTVYMVTGRHQ